MLLCVVLVLVAGVAAERNGNITTIEDLDKSNPLVPRITNGKAAVKGQFPWQVSISFHRGNDEGYCGGSLIHSNWILTAAHCVEGASSFMLKLGGLTLEPSEMGRVEVVATKYHVHPEYNANNLNNDIALIQMDSPMNLGETINTIRLPACGERTGVSQALKVSGWGKTSDASSSTSNQLKYVNVYTIDNVECARDYGSDGVKSSTLCCLGFNRTYTCNGDSGGPLIRIDSPGATQVGIVSFVHALGCGVDMPSGFTRTESYLNWIYQITGVVGSEQC